MTSLRKNDVNDNSPVYRSERIFESAGLWYFKTRENTDMGPFRYHSEALQMLTQYVADAQTAELQATLQTPKPHFRLSAGTVR